MTMSSKIIPLGQNQRPPCSIPLRDADLSLGNANWIKGLQSMSDWVWSGNLNPVPFPNNLGRYFLQVPAIFEQQLNFSTTLIFDEPSFRNGIQVSGFVDRVSRELAISLIAQLRHCWYSMTHHAVLGYLTAMKHGLTVEEFSAKWSNLTSFRRFPQVPTLKSNCRFLNLWRHSPQIRRLILMTTMNLFAKHCEGTTKVDILKKRCGWNN